MTDLPASPSPPRRGSAPRWVALSGIAMIVALAGCCAYGVVTGLRSAADSVAGPDGAATAPVSPGPRASQPPIEGLIGDPITITSGGDRFTATVRTAERIEMDETGAPAGRGMFLAVQVEVRAETGGIYPLAAQWRLIGADGTPVDPTPRPLRNKPVYSGTQLSPGQRADGWVVFDVPQAAVLGGRIEVTVTQLTGGDRRLYWIL